MPPRPPACPLPGVAAPSGAGPVPQQQGADDAQEDAVRAGPAGGTGRQDECHTARAGAGAATPALAAAAALVALLPHDSPNCRSLTTRGSCNCTWLNGCGRARLVAGAAVTTTVWRSFLAL